MTTTGKNDALSAASGEDSDELKNEQLMKVRKLRQGTVIDHLTSGTAFKAFRVLGLSQEEGVVLIGINLQSKVAGRKDIIKIENRELTRDELNRIALLSPQAVISIIEDYRVIKKFHVEVSEPIEGIIRCRNPKCVTNVENVRSRFRISECNPPVLRCFYCERRIKQGEFDFIV
jgi:aspartate carbamoyltransferase regulatory subunit